MHIINILHTGVGLIFLIIFLATGQYMGASFPDLYDGNEVVRVLYRANHIYILMAAMLNVTLGIYLIQHHKQDRKIIQWLASILILISPILFLSGFFYESHSVDLDRPFTFWGAVFILSGVLLNILAKIGDPWGSSTPEKG